MKKPIVVTLITCSFFCSASAPAQTYTYPVTRKVVQTDDYFGTKVSDPYRWLEDDRSKETAEWVKKENAVTEQYMSKIPFRKQLKDRMTKLWNFAKQTTPIKGGS